MSARTQPCFCLVYFLVRWASTNFDCWRKALGTWHLWVCYSPLLYTMVGIEDHSTPLWPGFAH
ncbi:hypothetical protein BDM02DRAFT_3235698, partial [Thelephora ganbajun]